jgi:hypothetical protein
VGSCYRASFRDRDCFARDALSIHDREVDGVERKAFSEAKMIPRISVLFFGEINLATFPEAAKKFVVSQK